MATEGNPVSRVLGFDPETGLRISEVQGQLPLIDNRVVVPQPIQERYMQWLDKYPFPPGTDDAMVSKEDLLLTIKRGKQRYRIYHLWNPLVPTDRQTFPVSVQAEFRENDRDGEGALPFEPYALYFFPEHKRSRARFEKSSPRDSFDSVLRILDSIRYEGKPKYFPKNGDAMVVRFNNTGKIQINLGIHFWIRSNNRTLTIIDRESVEKVRFGKDFYESYFDEEGADVFDIGLTRQGYGNGSARTGQSSEDENGVVINHTGRDGIQDTVILDSGFNDSQAIKNLFDETLLSTDPLSAPSMLDYSWRFGNILDIAGIHWDTTLVPQKPVQSVEIPRTYIVPVTPSVEMKKTTKTDRVKGFFQRWGKH